MEILTIYFDGRCPLCLAEIHVLRARHRHAMSRLAGPLLLRVARRICP